MAEPVLIIHGVANHESGPFIQNVATLQQKLGNGFTLNPVFWGDMGGQSIDITDCLPIHTATGWSVRSDEAISPDVIALSTAGTGALSQTERADIIARAATANGTNTVRGISPGTDIADSVLTALPSTRVLKYIDNPAVLGKIGELIRVSLEPLDNAGSTSADNGVFATRSDGDVADTRGIVDSIKRAARSVVESIDNMLGSLVGDKLGEFNQAFRGSLVGPFSLFFGDILVYQRNQERIQARLWEKIAEIAPGYGTQAKPIHVIAHSLGGLVAFDAAVRKDTKGRTLWMKSFTTFGSQPAFFHIIDPRDSLTPYAKNNPVTLPPQIAKWTNLWDTLDILAFTAGTVFRLHDGTVPTDIPVEDPLSLLIEEKGWAHSIYWKTEELLKALRKTLID